MQTKTYFTLQVDGVFASQEDLLTAELFEIGAGGVQENLDFTQKDRSYLPEVVNAEIKNLTVYFEELPDTSELQNLLAKYPNIQFHSSEHEVVDWLKQWKEQWKPFLLVNEVWIVPDWHRESFEAQGDQAIYIEPGMAFGTGTHATTQLASELLQELVQVHPLESLVDVGTGSGILSFLAGFLGFQQIYAYDNDPESHRVFHENLVKNPCPAIVWEENWNSKLQGRVDLTLANIIDGVLLNLKLEFQSLQSRYYLFTGILKEREAAFLQEMQEGWSLEMKSRKEKDEWVGFVFEAQS